MPPSGQQHVSGMPAACPQYDSGRFDFIFFILFGVYIVFLNPPSPTKVVRNYSSDVAKRRRLEAKVRNADVTAVAKEFSQFPLPKSASPLICAALLDGTGCMGSVMDVPADPICTPWVVSVGSDAHAKLSAMIEPWGHKRVKSLTDATVVKIVQEKASGGIGRLPKPKEGTPKFAIVSDSKWYTAFSGLQPPSCNMAAPRDGVGFGLPWFVVGAGYSHHSGICTYPTLDVASWVHVVGGSTLFVCMEKSLLEGRTILEVLEGWGLPKLRKLFSDEAKCCMARITAADILFVPPTFDVFFCTADNTPCRLALFPHWDGRSVSTVPAARSAAAVRIRSEAALLGGTHSELKRFREQLADLVEAEVSQ
jgi:hypothetical protein